MTLICHRCGADLSRPRARIRGDWTFFADAKLLYKGHVVPAPGYMRNVLYSLFRAYPKTLTSHVLANRADTSEDTIRVYICMARKWFRERDMPCPIETVGGWGEPKGYRWTS